ncbi:MAG: hypothetical protein H7Z38_19925 [Rubrivivax sp.]|nr:hypothetical protein [Pyrinomonadaceae bacterium]
MRNDEEGKADDDGEERASFRNAIILFAIIEALVLVPLFIYMLVRRM